MIGGRAHEHPALRELYGIKSDAELESPETLKLFDDASPLSHVSAGDPPVILFYAEPDGPLPAHAKPGQGIHHPRSGVRSGTSSLRSESNAFSTIATTIPRRMITTTTCSAT